MKFSLNPKQYDDVSTLSDNDLICYCCDVEKQTIVKAIKFSGSRCYNDKSFRTKAQLVELCSNNVSIRNEPTAEVFRAKAQCLELCSNNVHIK